MKLEIKVIPSSSRDCIAGWLNDVLKIRVRAPAERGKANRAVEKVLAEALATSSRRVSVVCGETSERKIIEIRDLSQAEVKIRLDKFV